jgi:hypothetical protein
MKTCLHRLLAWFRTCPTTAFDRPHRHEAFFILP